MIVCPAMHALYACVPLVREVTFTPRCFLPISEADISDAHREIFCCY